MFTYLYNSKQLNTNTGATFAETDSPNIFEFLSKIWIDENVVYKIIFIIIHLFIIMIYT